MPDIQYGEPIRLSKKTKPKYGEPIKPARVSNPIKQGIAGITDTFTGIPMALGLAGAGLESVYKYTQGSDPRSFGDIFKSSLSSGVDSTLFNAGVSGANFVNKKLGIDYPVSTEDQAARLLTSLAIPGLGPLSALSKGGKLANLARLATPVVKMTKKSGSYLNKGNAVRLGSQLGIGTGIDQGLRSYLPVKDTGLPTILSGAALSGLSIDAAKAQAVTNDTLQGGVSSDVVYGEPISLNSKDIKYGEPIVLNDPDNIGAYREARNRDLQITKKSSTNNKYLVAAAIGAALGIAGGYKYVKMRAVANAEAGKNAALGMTAKINPVEKAISDIGIANGVSAKSKVIEQNAKDFGLYFHGKNVDRTSAYLDKLHAAGVPDSTIEHIRANDAVDTVGMTQQFHIDGKLGQDTGLATHSVNQLNVERLTLAPEEQALFDKAVNFRAEQTDRIIGTAREVVNKGGEDVGTLIPGLQGALNDQNVSKLNTILNDYHSMVTDIIGKKEVAPGLWRNMERGGSGVGDPVKNAEIAATIKEANANPKIKALMNKTSDVYETMLQYMVKRGVLTNEFADGLRKRFTIGGELVYAPFIQATDRGIFWEKLSRTFGVVTPKARELGILSELSARGVAHGAGTISPINPLKAMEQYTFHVIDHTNRSSHQWNVVARLAGVDLDANGDIVSTVKAGAKDVTNDAVYVGKSVPSRGVKDHPIQYYKDYPKSKQNISSHSIYDVMDPNNKVLWIQHKNELHGFELSPYLRSSLEKPQLGAPGQFFNHWKRVFTSLTTGFGSVFAPTSFLYSAGQVMMTSPANKIGAFSTIKDSFKGAKATYMVNAQREIADYLTRRIATRISLGKSLPQAMTKLQDNISLAIDDSILNTARRETGLAPSGLNANEFSGGVVDIANNLGKPFSQTFGVEQMGLVVRMWKVLNQAMHEGPATGALMRYVNDAKGPLTPQMLRDAVIHSKDLAGNMKQMGAGKFITGFHASVPFSGAMVQAFNSIGGAIKKDTKRFVAALTATVGIPTVAELLYTKALDKSGQTYPDANGKSWSYNDYYWNGFTAGQRNNNIIVFVPSRPPWDAILVPLSPELSLGKAVVTELMDAVFNLSDVGEADLTGNSGNQITEAAIRVFDVPVPPPAKALATSIGINLRIGPSSDISQSASDPGSSMSLFRGIPLGRGNRLTGSGGGGKYADQSIDKTTSGIIQDIFGAAGSTYLAVHEAFNAGNKESLGRGIGLATDTFFNTIKSQARWTQPIFGKALRPNANNDISKQLLTKRRNLQQLKTDAALYFSNGFMSASGVPLRSQLIPPDDPVYQSIAVDAGNVLGLITGLDKQVADLRTQIADVGNSSTIDGKQVSIQQRNDIVDSITLQIQTLKAIQLANVIDYEKSASETLSERLGREVFIDLSTLKPRQ